jgi:kynurenine formamidase
VNSIVQITLIINPTKSSIVKMKLMQQSFFYRTAVMEAKMHTQTLKSVLAITFLLALTTAAFGDQHRVGQSPWGADDEIGRLNLITEQSRSEILSRISGGRSYDLSVEYFIGMPSWQAAGDPHYRIWMTHTPGGTVVDDPLGVGQTMNEHVSYTGSAVSMYTHTGTHIDSLNHFGLDGKIWNGFSAADHLGDRGWQVAGAENIPPIIARGVLIDVATAKGVDMLADGYRVTRDDLINALGQQGVELHEGDVVLIRTGWMKLYEDASAFMANSPGLGMAAAKFLVEENGAMIVGADNLSFEAFPSEVDGNYVPIHTYLLAQHGVPILELVNLEGLAEDRVYEFAFVGASLKLRGADAAPIRPIAFPVH